MLVLQGFNLLFFLNNQTHFQVLLFNFNTIIKANLFIFKNIFFAHQVQIYNELLVFN